MSYSVALKRAKGINEKTFLAIERLPNGLGFIASYASDQSLRSLGQTIISHADGRFGIVLDHNGFVPRELEVRDILHRAGMFPAGAPGHGDDVPLSTAAEAAVRMETMLRLHYPDLSDPENLLSAALCDLRHFADRHGLDFGAEDHTGFFKYLEEIPGERPTPTFRPQHRA
jgi:hypothetical protein